jgi:hypothetical protein
MQVTRTKAPTTNYIVSSPAINLAKALEAKFTSNNSFSFREMENIIAEVLLRIPHRKSITRKLNTILARRIDIPRMNNDILLFEGYKGQAKEIDADTAACQEFITECELVKAVKYVLNTNDALEPLVLEILQRCYDSFELDMLAASLVKTGEK